MMVFCIQPMVGQKNEWTLFTDSEGLPNNAVQFVRQDKLGYLWVQTRGGICKYDGRTFQTITFDASINFAEILDVLFDSRGRSFVALKPALFSVNARAIDTIGSPDHWKQNPITALLLDAQGRLWIGTRKGLFSYEKEHLRSWGEGDGILTAEISKIYEDRSGFLWVGFRNGGVAVAQMTENLSWRVLTTAQGLPHNVVNDISEDQDGTIWVSTLSGIARFAGGIFVAETVNEQLPTKNILSITTSRNGNRWLRLRAAGIAQLSPSGIRVFDATNGLPSNTILQMIEDRNGRIWLATANGIAFIRNDSVTSFAKEGLDIPKKVSSVFEDREGLLWFGTTEGLLRYDEGRFESPLVASDPHDSRRDGKVKIVEAPDGKLWFVTPAGIGYAHGKEVKRFGTKDGIPDDPVDDMVVDDKGTIWLRTEKGVFVYEAERFKRIADPLLRNKTVIELEADKFGHVWLLTKDNSVLVYEQGSMRTFDVAATMGNEAIIVKFSVDQFGTLWMWGIHKLVRIEGSKATILQLDEIMPNAGYINSLFVSKRGTTFFTTDRGFSVFSQGHFSHFASDSLWQDRYPTWIFEDSTGQVWLGIWSFALNSPAGVALFNGESIRFYSSEDGLPSNTVSGAYCDRTGSVWFLTDRGVSHFDGTTWISFTTEQGLAGNQVRKMLKGKDGSLWFVALGGISRFNGTTFSKLTREDGLLHPSINDARIDQQDNLWVATSVGVQRVNLLSAPPVIHVAEVRTNKGSFNAGSSLAPMKAVSEFTVSYRGLSFRSGQKRLLYFYRLVGYDKDWHGPTEQTSVSYFNLDPGDYRFSVKCTDADLMESNEAVVAFTILPPFWRTVWFGALSASLVLGFLYTGFRFRTRHLEKKSQMLAEIVRQRTEELVEEQRRSEELLNNILPAVIVRELKDKGSSEPREYRAVSILFTDFIGFTNMAASLPPVRLVGELNEVFKEFDEIIDRHGVEKLKTIGDAYLIASGLPTESPDHAIKAVNAALEMQNYIFRRNEGSPYKWQMRAGIHSGQVVAGIVGKRKFTYDVWGDTVNIASRMESAGMPGRINISAFTFDLVKQYFECEYRGKIEAKGKGSIDMYLVIGPRQSEQPTDPATPSPEIPNS
jgi:ligand-binding sensor domain-containing protein/class 3 adenylate cyclase